jgi:hypothetical protein
MLRPLAAVTVALGVAVAGCGSSSNTHAQVTTTDSSTVLTRATLRGWGQTTHESKSPESKEAPSGSEPANVPAGPGESGGTPPSNGQGGTPAP